MSLTIDSSDDEEKEFVRAKKIYEGTRYFFQQQLLSTFIFFEHKVHGTSPSRYAKCIEIVAFASNVVNKATVGGEDAIDDKSNTEASRLYLSSKKVFDNATFLEERKHGNSNVRIKRQEGSTYAQILMINYILPRIVVSKKMLNGNEFLQVEWLPLALDVEKDTSYEGLKILGQLPHIDCIT
jgi:hypothetical protein